MKKILLFMIMLIQIQCLGNAYSRLTSIKYDSAATKVAGQIPFEVTIQSSDSQGYVTLKNGQKPNIKDAVFNLNDLQYFGFVIPWKGWDGNALIRVQVLRASKVVAEMLLLERNEIIECIRIKNAEDRNISKKRHRLIHQHHSEFTGIEDDSEQDIDCSLSIGLKVDPVTGRISVDYAKAVECDDADQENRIHEE